jgi:3-methyladenine DNA glycosylase Tag
MHDSGYSGFGLDRFIQDSGLFRVQFRQVYSGFSFDRILGYSGLSLDRFIQDSGLFRVQF